MINNLKALLAKDEDNALLHYSLGSAYLKENDIILAIQHLARAVELDPNYSAAWKIYGKALVADGQQTEAIKAYESGIQVAEKKGDIQAAKEMKVFLKRLKSSN